MIRSMVRFFGLTVRSVLRHLGSRRGGMSLIFGSVIVRWLAHTDTVFTGKVTLETRPVFYDARLWPTRIRLGRRTWRVVATGRNRPSGWINLPRRWPLRNWTLLLVGEWSSHFLHLYKTQEGIWIKILKLETFLPRFYTFNKWRTRVKRSGEEVTIAFVSSRIQGRLSFITFKRRGRVETTNWARTEKLFLIVTLPSFANTFAFHFKAYFVRHF